MRALTNCELHTIDSSYVKQIRPLGQFMIIYVIGYPQLYVIIGFLCITPVISRNVNHNWIHLSISRCLLPHMPPLTFVLEWLLLRYLFTNSTSHISVHATALQITPQAHRITAQAFEFLLHSFHTCDKAHFTLNTSSMWPSTFAYHSIQTWWDAWLQKFCNWSHTTISLSKDIEVSYSEPGQAHTLLLSVDYS